MSSHNPTNQASQIREEVRRAVRQLSELSRTEESFDEFCSTVLGRLVEITGAHGALFWQVNGQGLPHLTHHSGQAPHDLAREILSPEHEPHGRVIMDVVRQKLPTGITSETFTGKLTDETSSAKVNGTDPASNGDSANPFLMLFSPVLNRQRDCIGTVELIQRGGISDKAKEGYLRFVTEIAILFQRWHEQQDLAKLSNRSEKWTERMQFINEVHGTIDYKETAYSIANEARRVLNADRVSVGRWTGRKCKITSISSQDRFDNRSNVVRKLSKVASAAVGADSTFWVTGDTEGLAPEVAKKINNYLDESHSRTLAVIPLAIRPPDEPDLDMKKRGRKKPRKLGAIVIEYFDADVTQQQVQDDCDLIVQQSQLALENARKHGEIFLQPVLKKLGWLQKTLFGDHLRKTLTGIFALGLVTLAMIFVPWELTMRVEGVLRPEVRRQIFAESKGIVEEVYFEEEDVVAQGQPLLKLRDFDREQQMRSLISEEERIEEQLDAVGRELNRRVSDEQKSQIRSQRASLGAELTSVRKRIEFGRKAAKQIFEVQSPIDGSVVTWNAQQRLKGLVVQPNQLLVSIAQLDGKWQLEVKIPHQKIGYVETAFTAAKEAGEDTIDVEFALSTNPSQTFKGKLNRISNRPHTDQAGNQNYRGMIEVDSEDLDIDELRPGSGATVRIQCGEVPLYKRCFYQVVDWVKANVLF